MENGTQPVKLNLGAGAKRYPGFISVDLADNWCKTPPDIVADVFKTLPFDDGYADEVHAYHVFEHTYRYQADAVLKDWVRVLKPGGLMVIEVPCLDKIISIFAACMEEGKAPPTALTMWGLFGDPKWKNPAMCHHWCYSVAELSWMMESQGLTVEVKEPLTHRPERDMRIEGRKG